MRLAWFTPFGRRSAVGEFSRHVTEALVAISPGTEIEIWAPSRAEDGRAEELLESSLTVRRFSGSEAPIAELRLYDHIIYNFGDYLPYHGDIYEVAGVHPGVVLLHDRVLHHFFADLWLGGDVPNPARYVQAMEAAYGERGRAVAASAVRGQRSPPWECDDEVMLYPMWEPAVVNATGVITHSARHRASLRDRWFGPSVALDLPCYREHLTHADSLNRTSAREGRLLALTLGNVNPNKQVAEVIELLAADETLASRLQYTVAGAYDGLSLYTARLRSRVEALKGYVDVRIVGYQPEAELRTLLAEADIFINLRHPSMESGSASLMRQLAYSRPVLCFSEGAFGELPADACLSVTSRDYLAVQRQLRRLVDDAELRSAIGQRGREVAEATSETRYAAGLLAFLDEVRAWSPVSRLLTTVGSELGGLGVHPGLSVFDRIAADFGPILVARRDGALAVREVTAADRFDLAALFERNRSGAVGATFDPFPLSAEEAERIAAHAGRDGYFVGVEGDTAVAMSMLRGFDAGFEVPSFGIFVDAEAQRRGIGRRLTEWTVKEARRRGAAAVRLSVYASNAAALALYDALGFVETDRENLVRDGRPDQRIVMRLELER
jgi:ribosomal protein S18 acetylase RimI-like enzyme/glycosyltransferase involved in cell wall biosynthesis